MASHEGVTFMAATTFKRFYWSSAAKPILFSLFALITILLFAEAGTKAATEGWREIKLPSRVQALLPGVNDAVVVNGKLILSVWGGQKIIVYEPAKPGWFRRDKSRIADVLDPVNKGLMLMGGGIAVASANKLLLALNGHVYSVPIDSLKPEISAATVELGFTRFAHASDGTCYGVGIPFVGEPKDGIKVWELTPQGQQTKLRLPMPDGLSGMSYIADISTDENSIYVLLLNDNRISLFRYSRGSHKLITNTKVTPFATSNATSKVEGMRSRIWLTGNRMLIRCAQSVYRRDGDKFRTLLTNKKLSEGIAAYDAANSLIYVLNDENSENPRLYVHSLD